MRADRLVTLLLLLQRIGKLTAAQAAVELEVSERTARRDFEALSMAGIPVYPTQGRGGGWQLIGGATTDLTGLSLTEARALFLSAGPALEATPELSSALRKLTAALPETFRDAAEQATTAIKLDAAGWGHVGPASTQTEHVDELANAILDGKRARIRYRDRHGKDSQRTIDPLGLVTKNHTWYLVAETSRGRRTFRLDRIASLTVLDAAASRPDDFDLDEAWNEIVEAVEGIYSGPTVTARIPADSAMISALRWLFGARLRILNEPTGGPKSEGTLLIELRSPSTAALAGQLGGFGGVVELLDPSPELTSELARIGHELVERYG